MMNRICILIFVCLSLAQCREGDAKKNTYWTTKILLKEPDKMSRLYRTEKFDSTGKLIEVVNYDNDLITSVVRLFYDTINKTAVRKTVNPGYIDSQTEMIISTYDDIGLLIQQVYIFNTDSFYKYFEYDAKNKLKKIKHFEPYWNGIEEYHYNENDSLYLIYMYDINMQNKQLHDSIVYNKDFKTIYTKSLDSFDSTKIFYKNGLKIRETNDSKVVNFTYDADKRLKKKEVMRYNDSCIPSPPIKEIYTYTYE